MIIDGKRHKGLQAYKVKGKNEYLYVHHDSAYMARGEYLSYDCYAVLQEGQTLPNCHTQCSDQYLREDCTEKSFAKLPENVQNHLRGYVS